MIYEQKKKTNKIYTTRENHEVKNTPEINNYTCAPLAADNIFKYYCLVR